MKKILYASLIFIAFGCETEIDPKLNTAEEIVVVDAWLNQKMERQEIRVTRSQPYFDNSVPQKIAGASVTVEDVNTGATYDFQEGTSSYFWDPGQVPFGEIGHTYRLSVTVEGETFEAFSKMGRVPPVDTITFKYNDKDFVIDEPYYTAEFMAIDPVGKGDTYWVKAWRNGVFLGKPAELNMVYDGGFSVSNSADGHAFLLPVRRDFVNPYDEKPGVDNEFIPPYLVGDSLHIEIHSLDHAAFDFLFAVYFHINRPGGFAELFSFPLANVPTNLVSTDENSATNVAGFFNVSAVSSKGQRLTEGIANEVNP